MSRHVCSAPIRLVSAIVLAVVLAPSAAHAVVSSSAPTTLVAIGDSITYGYGTADPGKEAWCAVLNDPGRLVAIKTFYGQTPAMAADWTTVTAHFDPDVVVLAGGINDVMLGSVSAAQINIAWMAEQALAEGMHPYIATLVATRSSEPRIAAFNPWIRSYVAAHPGVGLIDFYTVLEYPVGSGRSPYLSDWCHPTAEGHRMMASAVATALAAPVLDPIPTRSVQWLRNLTFAVTAVDPNEPADALRYSLAPGAPAGSSIASDGVFTWTPSVAQGPGDYDITVVATDADGGSDAKIFKVTVTPGASSISLAPVSRTIAYGHTATLSGVLRTADVGVAKKLVKLQTAHTAAGAFYDTGLTSVTGTGGAYSFTVKPVSKTYYRVVLAGDASLLGSTSRWASVTPRALVGTPRAPSTMSYGKHYTVSGYLKPAHRAGTYPVRIYKYKRLAAGRYKYYGWVRARASKFRTYTKYSRAVRLTSRGKWRLRAFAPADANHAASWSSGYVYVTVK